MSKNRLIIIGASGHGKVVADIALLNEYNDIVFLDDDESITECAGFPVVGKTDEAEKLEGDKIVAIGDAKIRKQMQNRIQATTLIHPDAVIGRNVTVGEGSVIMAGAVINADTVIGRGCIINTSSSVDHDCVIGDFTHIAVGAHVCGTVNIGQDSWIGAGATVSNNIRICDDVIIGAGAVVVKDIKASGTYIGVPANGGGYSVRIHTVFQTVKDWRVA